MTVFLGTVIAIWLGFGAAMPIDKAITGFILIENFRFIW
jgi:hypothetical protein